MILEQPMQRLDASSSPRPSTAPPRPPLAARLWPWVPGLLLTALIGTQLVVLSSVLEDPSFATEQDYYRKAVSWDAHMEQARESQALGWHASARVEAVAPGQARLEVHLVDAEGRGISGAHLSAVAFANTRSAQRLELGLGERAPGQYLGELGRPRPGLWEARLEATRGSDRYEATLRFEVFEAGARK
jgi:nitrogen fixation protein FixH